MASRWGYWEFAHGKFAPKELSFDEEEGLGDVPARLGIPPEPGSQFGHADQGVMVEVHALSSDVPSRYRYVVGVNINGCCERVVVGSLPDLIELLGKLAPLVNMSVQMRAVVLGQD